MLRTTAASACSGRTDSIRLIDNLRLDNLLNDILQGSNADDLFDWIGIQLSAGQGQGGGSRLPWRGLPASYLLCNGDNHHQVGLPFLEELQEHVQPGVGVDLDHRVFVVLDHRLQWRAVVGVNKGQILWRRWPWKMGGGPKCLSSLYANIASPGCPRGSTDSLGHVRTLTCNRPTISSGEPE